VAEVVREEKAGQGSGLVDIVRDLAVIATVGYKAHVC
jgi:hypothetical protein